ncbi:MAG: transposase [Candidatus Hydrogenedens sp.]|nr:transposase [Candidatus Hydrogenedens sp.]
MPRVARIVVPDAPHHVTQRGNRREEVFFTDRDRYVYLDLLQTYCRRERVDILAYCLMTNHVHLVLLPHGEHALGTALKPVHLRHAQHVNRVLGLNGHLWQGRFFSCPLDEAHLFAAVRYVERNPVRAGMVRSAWDYPWSSARSHVMRDRDPLLSDPLGMGESVGDWRAWLSGPDEADAIAALRRHTHAGRPLGGDTFLNRVEALLGRGVRPKAPGRPRKVPHSPDNAGTLG